MGTSSTRAAGDRASVPPEPAPRAPDTGPAEAAADRGNAFAAERLAAGPPPGDGDGAEVRGRLAAYAEAAPRFRARAARARDLEAEWLEGLGAIGSLIDLFGGHRPDAARWDESVAAWDLLGRQLAALAAPQPGVSVKAVAVAAAAEIQAFGQQVQRDSAARESFLAYLGEFGESAADGVWLATTARDAAFMSAVGTAAVIALPAITAGSAAVAGAAGLTGTAATIGSSAATWSAVALLGGGVEGSLRGGTALLDEMSEVLTSANAAGQRALGATEGVDWRRVADEGWSGFERGIVNGPFAIVGASLEAKMLAGPAQRLLDPVRAKIRGDVLQRALEAAIAGGAAYSVTGALRAGILAAEAGASADEIVSRMELGFATGLASGASTGGGLAAWRAWGASPPSAPASAVTPGSGPAPAPVPASSAAGAGAGTSAATRAAVAGAAVVGPGVAAASDGEGEGNGQVGSWFDRSVHAVGDRVHSWAGTAKRAYDGAVGAATDAMERAAAVRDAIRGTSYAEGDGTYAVETDLERVLPLLPADLQRATPLDPAAGNRARLELDTHADTVTLTVPDLALSRANLGEVQVAELTLAGLSLEVHGARALGAEVAKSVLNPSALDAVFGSSRQGAVHLRVARVGARGLRAPGGVAIAELDASGLEVDLGAEKGLADVAAGPQGVSGRFAVGAVRVRGLSTPGASAEAVSLDALSVDGDPSGAHATVGVGRLGARGVQAGDTSLGAAEMRGLRADLDANGRASALPAWALPLDPSAATGDLSVEHVGLDGLHSRGLGVAHAGLDGVAARKGRGREGRVRVAEGGVEGVHADGASVRRASLRALSATSDASGERVTAKLGRAKIGGVSAAGAKVGGAAVDGLSADAHLGRAGLRATATVDQIVGTDLSAAGVDADLVGLRDIRGSTGPKGHRGQVGLTHVAGVHGAGVRVDHATVLDAEGGVSGGDGSAKVRRASVSGVRGEGATVEGASVGGVGATWGGDGATVDVGDAGAWGAGYAADGTAVDVGSVAIDGVHAQVGGAAGARGSVKRLAAHGIGLRRSLEGGTSAGAATSGGGSAGDSGVKVDPAQLAGLVRDVDLDASVPLTAQRYGNEWVGATVEPGTRASVSAKVRDGAIDPAGTALAVSPGVDGPLWTSFDGVGLEADGDEARVRPRLGGLPDVDVTGFVPGFEDGVPRDLRALASRLPTGGGSEPAGTGSTSAGSASAGESPVDLDGLRAHGRARLGGAVDAGIASAELADQPGHNVVSVDTAGTHDVIVRFVGLLVGALRVDLPQGSGTIGKVASSGGSVELGSGGRQVVGTVGSVTVEDAEGRARP